MADQQSAESVADKLGVSQRSVERWKHNPELSAIVAKTREESADSIRAVASLAWAQLAQRVADGTMDDRDLIILAGVATDKAQLLSGEATSRTETRDITADMSPEQATKLANDIDEWLRVS